PDGARVLPHRSIQTACREGLFLQSAWLINCESNQPTELGRPQWSECASSGKAAAAMGLSTKMPPG
ncbi:MAG: hypothetical protein KBF33_09190, partial [Comamonas sp.]|nr:hypothetical protein [Comamonas sp.]